MVGFVITGHGLYAEGLYSAIKLIAGEQDDITPVTLTEENADTYLERLKKAVLEQRDRYGSCLIFTDLFGGSPFTKSMMIALAEPKVEVLAGSNLPSILALLSENGIAATASDFVELACREGKDAIRFEHPKDFLTDSDKALATRCDKDSCNHNDEEDGI